MTRLWSDYVYRLCRKCGRFGFCRGEAAPCRDCQLTAAGR